MALTLGSCWCLQRARWFGQRKLLLPYAWKSLICVAFLVFPFSLLWPTLLTCSGHASVTATSLSFLEVYGFPTLFSLNYLVNWYQKSSQVQWCACHAWFVLGTLSLCLLYLFLFFLLLFPCDARYPSQLLKEVSVIGSHWSVCNAVVFTHLQCGLEPRNLDGTDLGGCWCFQRARRFGQRELLLPYAWKSLICVACLVFLLALANFAYM